MQRKVCRVTVAGFAIIPDGAPAFRWSHCTSSVSRRISRAAGRWRRSGRLRRRNRMIRPRAYMGWMAAGTLVLCTAARSAENAPLVQRGVRVEAEVQHDTSTPLRQMPPALRAQGQRVHPVLPLPRHGGGGVTAADPVLQSLIAQPLAPALTLNFDGVGNGFSGPAGTFTVAGAPPDTNGSVGPNHYVQIVNADFAVFDKSGAALFGPVPINTLWSGFGGDCETNNDGDPVVEYDKLADRWVIAQPSFSTLPYLECVAVSTSGDPTGTYNRYSFSYTDFPDYPKIGVWPDAYYATFNFFTSGSGTFSGGEVCAYDRASMLAGQAATQQCFNVGTSFGGLLPADLDGGRQPPAGSPNYVVSLGAVDGQLAFWQFHVDWTTPANTTLTGPTTLTTAAFTLPCNDTGGTCVAQSGTTQQLDTLGDRLMYRLAYRNFSDHEALVVNHSITAGSSVGLRWYELRPDASHNLAIFQQGTYAPDSDYRWMGSIAMDQAGNMALGFSRSGTTLNPAIHFTGRLAGDAPGLMSQGEGTIIDGTGSQTGRNQSRWGDYSAMAIDPSDDCTFWYTNEYLSSNGGFNWQTRIASFKLPGCPASAGNDFSISASPTSLSLVQGTSGSTSISTGVTSGTAGTVSLAVSGVPSGASASLTPTSVSAGSSATLNVSAGSAAAGTYTLTVTGTEGSVTHTTTVQLTVTAPGPNFTISASPSSVSLVQGASGSSTISTTVVGSGGTISLTVSGTPSGASASVTPTSVSAGSSATLNVNAGSAAAGAYTLTVTGTEGSVTHTTTVQLTVTAPTKSTTTTTLSSSPNPSLVGQTVTFTATVTSTSSTIPNGETITFTFNGTVLGTATTSAGTASLGVSSLPAGSDTVTASYPGDATNQPSSASVAQVGSTGSSGPTSGAGSGSGGGGGFSGVDVGGLLLLLITAMARRRVRFPVPGGRFDSESVLTC